jgi:NAD-dependent SIR2 family protein deacetylase
MSGMMEQYRCERCKEEFYSNWTDAEAREEFALTFGRETKPEDAVICDDCYKELKAKLLAAD